MVPHRVQVRQRGDKAAKAVFVVLVLQIVAQPATSAASAGMRETPTVTPQRTRLFDYHWTVEDGLPQRVITSLAQTPDGH